MTDEELAVNWIRSQGWNEENLPSDEFRQMFDAYLAGIKKGSQLDRVWHDYDAGEDCYEDSHEGRWVKRETDKQKWHDLREDPNDLPNIGQRVLANNISTIECVVFKKEEDGNHWKHDKFELCHVIKWCEMPEE